MPQKKYSQDDVQTWTDKEVSSWIHSKGLLTCLPDFSNVNGYMLLSLTNDDLKRLPTCAGNEKRRKALKKALGSLPGNSVTKSKSKQGAKSKSKGQLASPSYPPPSSSLGESLPPVPPHPPSFPHASSFSPPVSSFQPPPSPQSPNSATYSDPTLLYPGDDMQQELYDNPDDIREREQDSWDGMGHSHQAPPSLPPHPTNPYLGAAPQQGIQGYQEEDEQMIYEQYEEDGYGEEEEIYDDSSFASEEEDEEGEENMGAVNGHMAGVEEGSRGRAESEATIRALRARFYAGGLTAHTGISTFSTSTAALPPQPQQPEDEYGEGEDEDIYDIPPEELRSHPPPHNIYPPEGPPPGHLEEQSEEEGDIYDIVEEVIRTSGYKDVYEGGVASIPVAPPPPDIPPPEEGGEEEMIYDTATADEPPPPSPPPEPPQIAEEGPPPPRPPKPGSASGSPAVFRRDILPPPQPAEPVRPTLPSMRGPIQNTGPPMRGPIASRPIQNSGPPMRGPIASRSQAVRPPIQSMGVPSPHPLPETAPVPTPPAPPPPPPPPVVSQAQPTGSPLSARPLKRDNVASSLAPHSNNRSPFSSPKGGRKFPRPSDNKSPSPQAGRVFPKPSEAKSPPPANSSEERKSEMRTGKGGGAPVPGQFVARRGAGVKPPGNQQEGEEEGGKPALPGKPMSVHDRIKMWKKPEDKGSSSSNGDQNQLAPPLKKVAEGVSPMTGRKLKKEISVTDLIKNYHGGSGSSGGEREERTLSPDRKPFLPPKPPGASPKHTVTAKSPQLERRRIEQVPQDAPPPSLPSRRATEKPPLRQDPAWKKPATEEPPKPAWQKREEEREAPKPQPVQRKEEAKDTRPAWKKPAEETKDTRPAWKKPAEETKDTRPAWKKPAEEAKDTRPAWKKPAEEAKDTRPAWKKPAEETKHSRPAWKKPAEEAKDTRPAWKKPAEEAPKPHQRWKAEEEIARAQPPWKQREEQKSEPPVPPVPPPAPPAEVEFRDEQTESGTESPSMARKRSFTYKPYSAKGSVTPPPPIPEIAVPETPPPEDPPRKPRITPRSAPSPPVSPTEPSLPPRPPKISEVQGSEPSPPEVPRLPQHPAHNFEPAPEAPQLPQRPQHNFVPESPQLPQRPQHNFVPESPQLPQRPQHNFVPESPQLPQRPQHNFAPESPQLPQRPQHNFEPAPDAPQLPQRPPPRHRPSSESIWQPQRPPKSEFEPAPPPPRALHDGSPVGQTWYHANLKDRKVAEGKLRRYSKDGTFIIRDSSRTAGEYSLSLLYHGAIKHLRIRLRADRQFVLGEEKPDEVAFASVVDLVNHHKHEPLVLKSGGEITLKFECPP